MHVSMACSHMCECLCVCHYNFLFPVTYKRGTDEFYVTIFGQQNTAIGLFI